MQVCLTIKGSDPNTHIVDDTSITGAFVNGEDTIVQLTGLVTVDGFTGAVSGGGTFVLV